MAAAQDSEQEQFLRRMAQVTASVRSCVHPNFFSFFFRASPWCRALSSEKGLR